MLDNVKIDKLRFGSSDKLPLYIIEAVEAVCKKYYEGVSVVPASKVCHKLTVEVTPTKQLRNGFFGANHNLQMIPLDQFINFLKEVRTVVGTNLNIYEMHLTKDIVTDKAVEDYT